MSSISTIVSLEKYFSLHSTSSLRHLLFNAVAPPLSIRDRLKEIEDLDSTQIVSSWERAQEYILAFHNYFFTLSEEEQQIIRDLYLEQIPQDGAVSPLVALAALPNIPIPRFPQLPRISIPNVIFVPDLVQAIEDKLGGLIGSVWETIKQIMLGIPEEFIFIMDGFASRIIQLGELLRDGEVFKALGKLLEAVALLVRDAVGSVVSLVVNAVNDSVSGIIGGLLFSRVLSDEEKDFAHGIFGGLINLTFVRIAPVAFDESGMVAGSVIFVDGINLGDAPSRSLFAHELTHVWQDQTLFGDGTRTATKEQLSHWGWGAPDPYLLPGVNASTEWRELKAEQKAELVGGWQNHLDTTTGGYPGTSPLTGDPTAITNYWRILSGQQLF